MLDMPCVIFAGGKSSRMGEDKSLLPFSTFKTLIQFQLFRLSKIFKTVYISCKDKNKFDFDANFIEDIKTDAVFAPTVGFVTLFKNIDEDRFFVLSVDSPFVGVEEILRIAQADEDELDATIAKTDGRIQPLCGVYHRSLSNKFVKMLQNNDHKLGHLLKNSNVKYVSFTNEEAFLNLNNPHEYEKALTLI